MKVNPRASPEDVVCEFSFVVYLSRLGTSVSRACGRCQIWVLREQPVGSPLKVLLLDLHPPLDQLRHRQAPRARLHLLPMREFRDLRDREDDVIFASHDGYHRQCRTWSRLDVSFLFGTEDGSVNL